MSTSRDFTRDLRRAGYLDDDAETERRIDAAELARDEPPLESEQIRMQDRADALTYGDNPNLP